MEKKFKSILSNQEIYDYKDTHNVLIYKNHKIPCRAIFDENKHIIFTIDKVYMTSDLVEGLTDNDIIINDNKYYKCSDIAWISSYNCGEPLTFGFKLISYEPFDIEIINLFGGND